MRMIINPYDAVSSAIDSMMLDAKFWGMIVGNSGGSPKHRSSGSRAHKRWKIKRASGKSK